MNEHQTPSKGDDGAPQAGESNDSGSEIDRCDETVEENAGLSPAAGGSGALISDGSSKGEALRISVEHPSIRQVESAPKHPHGLQIDVSTDAETRPAPINFEETSGHRALVGIGPADEFTGQPTPNEGGDNVVSASSSTLTQAISLIGRVPLNLATPSAVTIPSQPGLLTTAINQTSLSNLIRSQAPRASTNSSLTSQLSSVPPLSSFAGLQVPLLPQPQTTVSPPSTLQASLLGQLQLASLAQNISVRQQIPQTPAPATASSFQTSMLEQLAAAQTNAVAQASASVQAQANQTSHFQPTQSASALINSYLLHRYSSSQNPSLPPTITPQDQSQLIHSLTQENMIKDQIIALLLPQQQAAVTKINSTTAQMPAPTPSPGSQLELLLQSIGVAPISSPESSYQGADPVSVSSYPLQQQQPPNPHGTSSSIASGAISSSDNRSTSDLTAPGHLHAPNQSKEKRWMMRYEELRIFQGRHGHCRVPHGYAENRKLSWWVMNQRAQYQLLRQGRKSWLTEERVALLDALGFDWNPIIGKSCSR